MNPPDEKRIWPTAVFIGALSYLIFLVGTAPAVAAAWLIERASSGLLTVEEAEGRLWHGSGAITISPPDAPRQRFPGVTWRLSAAMLFRGQLAVHVVVAGPSASGRSTIAIAPHSARFHDLALTLPAAALASWLPALQVVKPGGVVRIESSNLAIGAQHINGAAQIRWIDASTALTQVAPLGTYQLDLKAQGSSADFSVATAAGALHVSGKGRWAAAEGLRFAGEARPEAAQALALRPLLALFGAADSRGNYPLKYSNMAGSR